MEEMMIRERGVGREDGGGDRIQATGRKGTEE
jgi:hypothetical protein